MGITLKNTRTGRSYSGDETRKKPLIQQQEKTEQPIVLKNTRTNQSYTGSAQKPAQQSAETPTVPDDLLRAVGIDPTGPYSVGLPTYKTLSGGFIKGDPISPPSSFTDNSASSSGKFVDKAQTDAQRELNDLRQRYIEYVNLPDEQKDLAWAARSNVMEKQIADAEARLREAGGAPRTALQKAGGVIGALAGGFASGAQNAANAVGYLFQDLAKQQLSQQASADMALSGLLDAAGYSGFDSTESERIAKNANESGTITLTDFADEYNARIRKGAADATGAERTALDAAYFAGRLGFDLIPGMRYLTVPGEARKAAMEYYRSQRAAAAASGAVPSRTPAQEDADAALRGYASLGGVFLGSEAAKAVGTAGLKLLRGMNKVNAGGVVTTGADIIGQQNKILPNILLGGASGVGYSLGQTGVEELYKALTDENYTPNWTEIGTSAAAAFAFGAISSAIRTWKISGENKVRMEQINEQIRSSYEQWQNATTPEQKAKYAANTMANANVLRHELNELHIPGADRQVRDAADFLWSIEEEMMGYAEVYNAANTEPAAAFGGGAVPSIPEAADTLVPLQNPGPTSTPVEPVTEPVIAAAAGAANAAVSPETNDALTRIVTEMAAEQLGAAEDAEPVDVLSGRPDDLTPETIEASRPAQQAPVLPVPQPTAAQERPAAREETRDTSEKEPAQTPAEAVTEETREAPRPAQQATTDAQTPTTDAKTALRESAQRGGMGRHGVEAIAEFYSGEDVPTFYGDFARAYTAGREGRQIETGSVVEQAAWTSGRMDAVEAGNAGAAQNEERVSSTGKYRYQVVPSEDGYVLRISDSDGNASDIPGYTSEEEARREAEDLLVYLESDSLEAYNNAITDKEGAEYGGGAESVRPGSAGVYAQRPGQQTGTVQAGAEGTGRQRGAAAQTGRTGKGNLQTVSRRIVRAEEVIPGAEPGQKLVVLDGPENADQREGYALAKKNGIQSVTPFEGGVLAREHGVIGEKRAFQSGGRIGAQVNNEEITFANLVRHEIAEYLISHGRMSVDAALATADVDSRLLDAVVDFYYGCLRPKDRQLSTEEAAAIREDARRELVCDAGDHINQLRYDVEHGALTGEYYRNMADLLDTVLDAVHAAESDLTDGAFELSGQTEESVGAEAEGSAESGMRFSSKITRQQDADYLAAVKRGDMETAQRMVDEAAEIALANSKARTPDGKLMRVRHGTNAEFTVFDPRGHGGETGKAEGFGIYVTDSPEVSKNYGARQLDGYAYTKRPAYANKKTIRKPELVRLIKAAAEYQAKKMVEAGDYGSVQEALPDSWISNYANTYEMSLQDAYASVADQVLRYSENDADIVREVMGGMAIREYDEAMDFYRDVLTPTTGIDSLWTVWKNAQGDDANVLVLFDSSQFKSADPVTYDDNGNPIPLSERFNPEDPDIRFSSKLTAENELRRQNLRLQEQLEEAKKQTERTVHPEPRKADVDAVARDFVKRYGSSIKGADISADIGELAADIFSGDTTFFGIKEKAAQIARKIVDNAEELQSPDMDGYRQIKAQLRQPIIISARDAHDVSPEWGAWRNEHRGQVNVSINGSGTPVDVMYAQLSEAYPAYFPEDITHPADQVLQMVEVMDALAPVMENPFSYDMAEAIEYCANDLIASIADMRAQAPTFADLAARELAEAKVKGKIALENLRAEKNAKIEDLKQRNAWATAQKLAQVRAQRDEQIKTIKEVYAESRKAASERREESILRQRLLKHYRRLNNAKLPALTKSEIARIGGELDTIAVSITERKIVEAKGLYDFLRDKTEKGRNPDLYDPDFVVDRRTLETAERWEKTQISQLTATDVRERLQALLNIEARLAAEKKLVKSSMDMMFAHAAQRVMNDLAVTRPGHVGSLLRPTTAALRITYNERSPLTIAMREMVQGEERADLFKREATKPFLPFMSNKEFWGQSFGKKAKAVKIQGVDAQTGEDVTVEITPMMRIGLYLHSLNNDNYRHIYKGGIVVPDMELYRKGKTKDAYNAGKTIKLSRTQLQRIAEQMTQTERDFAKNLQWYFNEYAPQIMNRTSSALDGYEKFTTKDYYPITVDRDFLHADFEGLVAQGDASLARPGFGEERIQSVKPIVLYDANSLLFDMINRNAAYSHQAIPLYNMNHLLNMEFDKEGKSVKKSLNQAFTDGSAMDYLNYFMSDYGGHKRAKKSALDKYGGTVDKIRDNYAGGVLTLAASTAFVQFASYPTAACTLSHSALLKAMAPTKIDLSYIDRQTAVFTKRTEGFISQEMGDLKEHGKHIPKALNWIQGVDVFTTSLLKRAAYFYTREQNPNLATDSDEFRKKVVENYVRTVEQTQPNYSVALRPEIQRNPDPLTRSLIMFVTQPLQQYNLIYEAAIKLDMAQRADWTESTPQTQAALKNAKKNMAKTAVVLVESSFLYAVLKLAASVIMGKFDKRYGPQHKDDDPTWAFIRRFGGDMRSAITGMIPMLNIVIKLIEAGVDTAMKKAEHKPIFYTKWYGLEVSAISAISGAAEDSMKALATLATARDRKSVAKAAKATIKAAEDIALLFGIPAQKAHEDLAAIAGWFGLKEDDLWDALEG